MAINTIQIGNIFYEQGIAVISDQSIQDIFPTPPLAVNDLVRFFITDMPGTFNVIANDIARTGVLDSGSVVIVEDEFGVFTSNGDGTVTINTAHPGIYTGYYTVNEVFGGSTLTSNPGKMTVIVNPIPVTTTTTTTTTSTTTTSTTTTSTTTTTTSTSTTTTSTSSTTTSTTSTSTSTTTTSTSTTTTTTLAPATVLITNKLPNTSITNVTGIPGYTFSGPINPGGSTSGYHSTMSGGSIVVTITGSAIGSTTLELDINNVLSQTKPISAGPGAAGTYTFTGVSALSTDSIEIALNTHT